MKNFEILNLAKLNVLDITAHDLDAASAYKVFKFKKVINDCLEKIQNGEKELLKTCEIDDPEEFNSELNRLKNLAERTEEENKSLEEYNKKLREFYSLQNQLYGEDADLSGIKKLPYDQWKKLQDENHSKDKDPLTGYVEISLENILWEAPEE